MNTRFWTKKDVDRSKDFMFAIQKRLKTRRIFRNLESFVGGRIREGDYRKILRVLRIILVVLPEHLSDTKVLAMKMEILLEPTSNKLLDQEKMEMETPRSSGVNSPPNAHT
ncbi:hypothetical protein Tco_1029425 [Tanacetum coccineum]|uniref:Uncharacterized protein n=1 Tax=Tanacetum coccineum TaxID=301880 RepID=A0ABQ5G3Y1_9ASTR